MEVNNTFSNNSRWVKFEEEVEEGGNRWSKPHVGTLNLHSLFELRSMFLQGSILLNLSANNLDEITEIILDDLVNNHNFPSEKRSVVKDAILKRHCHQHEKQHHSPDDNKNNPEAGLIMQNNKIGCSGVCGGMKNIKKLSVVRSLSEIGKTHSNSGTCTKIFSPEDNTKNTNSMHLPVSTRSRT